MSYWHFWNTLFLFSVSIYAYRHFSVNDPYSLFEMEESDLPDIGETYK